MTLRPNWSEIEKVKLKLSNEVKAKFPYQADIINATIEFLLNVLKSLQERRPITQFIAVHLIKVVKFDALQLF